MPYPLHHGHSHYIETYRAPKSSRIFVLDVLIMMFGSPSTKIFFNTIGLRVITQAIWNIYTTYVSPYSSCLQTSSVSKLSSYNFGVIFFLWVIPNDLYHTPTKSYRLFITVSPRPEAARLMFERGLLFFGKKFI